MTDALEKEIDVKKIFSKFKWQYAVLILMILFGAYLRVYHIDYPIVGYHNMKEDHYLSLVLNMNVTGNYLRTTWYDCSTTQDDPFGDPYKKCSANWGEHPVAVWMILLAFMIFGWKLWVARSIIVIFSVLTIIPIYLIIKKLSSNEYLAILSAFIYTILPLSVVFGRNIQMDAPAYFFSLMALYYFMLFIFDNKRKDFMIACVYFVLASWFKSLLLMVLFAIIFVIPWSSYKKYFTHLWDYKVEIAAIIISLLLFAIWPLYLAQVVMPDAKVIDSAGMNFGPHWFGKNGWFDTSFSIFTSQYWATYKPIIFSYFADNYSWLGFWLMIIGFVLFALKYKSKTSKFIFGYAIGIAIYLPIMANKWNAHNYYQFPFLMFAALCIANVFFQAGVIIKSFFHDEKIKRIVQFIPLIALLLLIAPFTASTDRMRNTQFFGQDVAGTYIHEHTYPNEIFLLERGIQNEVSWYAQRFYYSVPDDVEVLKRIETEKNLRYIVMTYSGVSTIQQKKSWEYIKENYHIVQVGFVQTQQGPQVYHMVLKKGGTFNTSSLNTQQARLAETYEFTYTKIPYYVVEQP